MATTKFTDLHRFDHSDANEGGGVFVRTTDTGAVQIGYRGTRGGITVWATMPPTIAESVALNLIHAAGGPETTARSVAMAVAHRDVAGAA